MISSKKLWIVALASVLTITAWIFFKGDLSPWGATADGYDESVYLPLVSKNRFTWLSPTQFGVQSYSQRYPTINDLTVVSGNYWVRIETLAWDKIEAQKGVYQWNSDAETQTFEQELRAIGLSGMQPIVVVKFAPQWARKYENLVCGPFKQEAFQDFANFMTAAVGRYSQFPYNVKYWELGNEPDVDFSRVTYNRSGFGCWGEPNQTNYGGEYYAEMLKVVYPAIKAADPEAKVLIGGLLLDCDSNYSYPSGYSQTFTCYNPTRYKSGRFLRGILEGGGGNSFDYVSFHGYAAYNPNAYGGKGLGDDVQSNAWKHRGGIILGKLSYLRSELAAKGVSKPFLLTEAALTCPEWNPSYCNPPGSTFYEVQADYVVWVYVRAWANGITGTTWYAFENVWRYNGFVNGTTPKPAYNVYKYMISKLGTATYEKQITSYKIGTKTWDLVSLGIKAYQFKSGSKWLWVAWSENEADTVITLPGSPTGAYDKYGNPWTISGDKKITINHPTYIEFSSAP